MEFQKIAIKAAPENDAVIRFYAMLNMMVTFKGRPMYHIDDKILELRVKQPLGERAKNLTKNANSKLASFILIPLAYSVSILQDVPSYGQLPKYQVTA